MSQIRVLHLVGTAAVGGLQRQLVLLLDAIDEKQIISEIALFRGGPLVERFAARAPVHMLNKRRAVDPQFAMRLIRLIRATRPDIVQTWGPTPNLWGPPAAKVARAPYLIITHRELDLWKGEIRSWLDGRFGRWADAVVVNASAVAETAQQRGSPRHKVHFVPNAVEIEPLTHSSRDPSLVVLLGRIDPRKGHDLLIEALPTMVQGAPDLRVVFAGHAVLPTERAFERSLRARISQLGLDPYVEFLGHVEDVRALLQRAAVAVTPSRSEGMPNTVLEAMVHGAPVVAARVGGVPDIVDDHAHGLLIPPEDPAALARAVLRILHDDTLGSALAEAARQRVERDFSPRAAADRWTAIYSRVIGVP